MRTPSSKAGSDQDQRESARGGRRQDPPQPRNPVAGSQMQPRQNMPSARGNNRLEGDGQGPAKNTQNRKGQGGRGQQGAPGQRVGEGPSQGACGDALVSAAQANSSRQPAGQDVPNDHRPAGSNHSGGSHGGRKPLRGHVRPMTIHVRSPKAGPRQAAKQQNLGAVRVGSQNHQDSFAGQEQMAAGPLPIEQAPTRNTPSDLQQAPVRQGSGHATGQSPVGEAPVNVLLQAAPRAQGSGHNSGQAEAGRQFLSGQPGRGRGGGTPTEHGEQERIALWDRLRVTTRTHSRSSSSARSGPISLGTRTTVIKVRTPPKQSGSGEQRGNPPNHQATDSRHAPSPLGQASAGGHQGRDARALRGETGERGPSQAGRRSGGRGQQVLPRDGLGRTLPGGKRQGRAGTRPAGEGCVSLPPPTGLRGAQQLPEGVDPQLAGSEEGGKPIQEARPGRARHEVLPLALGQPAGMYSNLKDLQGNSRGTTPKGSPRPPKQRGERPAQRTENNRGSQKPAVERADRGAQAAGDQTPPSRGIEALQLSPRGNISNTRSPAEVLSTPPSAMGLYAGPSHAASSPHPSLLPMPRLLWRDPVPRLGWHDAPDDVAKDPP